jgi:SAM-dependent methyltransferase
MSLLFEECRGVDIAESMLAAARELTADRPNCTFDLAEGDGLPRYADGRFDFVYSSRVLQHLPSSRAIHRLIGELLRVLAPGGVLVFQLPAGLPLRRRLQPRRRAYAVLRSIGLPAEVLLGSARLNPMVVLGVAASEVEATVELHGGRIIETVASMIPGTGIRQSLYFVTGRDERPGAAGNPA